jgi:hypothetical protein
MKKWLFLSVSFLSFLIAIVFIFLAIRGIISRGGMEDISGWWLLVIVVISFILIGFSFLILSFSKSEYIHKGAFIGFIIGIIPLVLIIFAGIAENNHPTEFGGIFIAIYFMFSVPACWAFSMIGAFIGWIVEIRKKHSSLNRIS